VAADTVFYWQCFIDYFISVCIVAPLEETEVYSCGSPEL